MIPLISPEATEALELLAAGAALAAALLLTLEAHKGDAHKEHPDDEHGPGRC